MYLYSILVDLIKIQHKDRKKIKGRKGVIPSSTKRSNAWAWNNFDEWLQVRNVAHPADPVPNDLLSLDSPDVVGTNSF